MIKNYSIFLFFYFVSVCLTEASEIAGKPVDAAISSAGVGHYHACVEFVASNLRVTAISSAQQDIDCYAAIYEDCGWRNSWFTGSTVDIFPDERNTQEGVRYIRDELFCTDPIFESQHERIKKKDAENFKEMEQKDSYKQPHSFPNYAIFDEETMEIVGKFIFMGLESGRVESGIYILSRFRGKKYSNEILAGVIRHIITPAIGKSFDFYSTRYQKFKGMYAKVLRGIIIPL